MLRYIGITIDQSSGEVFNQWSDDDKTEAVITAEWPFEQWPLDEDQWEEIFAAAEGIECEGEAGELMDAYQKKHYPRPKMLVSTVLDTETGEIVYVETCDTLQWPTVKEAA